MCEYCKDLVTRDFCKPLVKLDGVSTFLGEFDAEEENIDPCIILVVEDFDDIIFEKTRINYCPICGQDLKGEI